MNNSRRNFLIGSALTLGGIAAGTAFKSAANNIRARLLSAFEDARGDQYVGGAVLETQQSSVPRCRCVRMAAQFIRLIRSECCSLRGVPEPWLRTAPRLDESSHRFRNTAGRHLAGHGLFSHDGQRLFTPEYDYEHQRGVLAVRDARDFHIIDEIDTLGLDPHEVAWLPDGRSLLVANGGIMTHPRNFRRKLNIPTMDPSLCAIDASNGRAASSNGGCRITFSAFVISQLRPVELPQLDCSTKVSPPMRRALQRCTCATPVCNC